MAKLTLTDLGSLTPYSNTAINTNNAAIETALENTLSRDGTSPNEMESDLDMNSNRIYNLPVPVGLSDAARWQDVVNLTVDSILDPTASFAYLNLATNFATTNVGPTIEAVQVAGYSSVGVGPALWRKVGTLPTHAAYRTSQDGYYFVPDVIQLDSTMSPATTGDQVIAAAIALGCGFKLLSGQTGSVTLGLTGSDFSTVATLKTFLSKSNVSMGAFLSIKINGQFSANGGSVLFDWDHPDAQRIEFTCGDSYTILNRTIASSGHSVTGTFRNYSVTMELDDVTGISVGDIARVQYVKDNRRIEWGYWGGNANIGHLTRVSSARYRTGNAAGTSHVDPVFLNALAVNDLILNKGETRRVASIVDADEFTVDSEFTNTDYMNGAASGSHMGVYWYRLAGGYGVANVCTSPSPGTPSTTLNFTDTSVLYLGCIVVADGQAGRIVSIDSGTACTMHTLMDVPASTPFAVIGLSYCFEGAHEITAVDTGANTITMLNKAALPETVFDFNADYINGGVIDICRAGLKNTSTGDVFNFRTGNCPNQIDNIYLWPGSSGWAIETGSSHSNPMPSISIQLGRYLSVVNGLGGIFAHNSNIKCAYSGGTNAFDTIAPMFSGQQGTAYVIYTWAGRHHLRGVKITGSTNTYAYYGSNGAQIYNTLISVIAGCNSGSYTLQGTGLTGDDQHYYFTGWTQGSGSEAGTYVAFRSVGCNAHDTQIRAIGHGGDGPSYNVGAAARIAGGLIIAMAGAGMINNDSVTELTGINILGSGGKNYSATGLSSGDARGAAFTNSTNESVYIIDRSHLIGDSMTIKKGGTYSLRVDDKSFVKGSGVYITGGGINTIHGTGVGMDVFLTSPIGSPTLTSAFTMNYIDEGRIIRNTNSILYPQILTADLANNFGVINSDARATFTVTVTGARVGDIALVTTTGSSLIGDTATRITLRAFVSATDTVTVEAMNNTATNSSDPANLTFRVVVLRFT